MRPATVLLPILLSATLVAQTRSEPSAPLVEIPFVGCPADGQAGSDPAPQGTSVRLSIEASQARQLAYYKAVREELDVLAPRGWSCALTYGSGGTMLHVSPDARRVRDAFGQNKFSGPVVEMKRRFGGTSGRFEVADLIGRVFPAYSDFATDVRATFDMAPDTFHSGPFSRDVLAYQSDRVVQYSTPPNAEGLGTQGRIAPSSTKIFGVALLMGGVPDAVILAVRLPGRLVPLVPAIIHQLIDEAAHTSSR